jgi:hypothetical protein
MGKIYMKIGAVVSYCENDHKFLEPCVKSLKKVCSNIVISYCERYLDGSEQNLDRLNQFLKDNPEVIAASFPHENAFSADPRSGHNFARIVGYEILRGITNKIMFVDTDEILDAESFKIWANQSNDIDILDHMTFGIIEILAGERFRQKIVFHYIIQKALWLRILILLQKDGFGTQSQTLK